MPGQAASRTLEAGAATRRVARRTRIPARRSVEAESAAKLAAVLASESLADVPTSRLGLILSRLLGGMGTAGHFNQAEHTVRCGRTP